MEKNKRKRAYTIAVGLYVLLLTAWLCFSCSPCERLARKCPPIEYVRDSVHVNDTVWIETIVTDTPMVVRLPPEYILIERSINDTARGETAFTRGLAWVDGESVRLELINKDSAAVLVQRIRTLERQLRESYREKETGKVQPVYQTRGIVKVFAWIGLLSVF